MNISESNFHGYPVANIPYVTPCLLKLQGRIITVFKPFEADENCLCCAIKRIALLFSAFLVYLGLSILAFVKGCSMQFNAENKNRLLLIEEFSKELDLIKNTFKDVNLTGEHYYLLQADIGGTHASYAKTFKPNEKNSFLDYLNSIYAGEKANYKIKIVIIEKINDDEFNAYIFDKMVELKKRQEPSRKGGPEFFTTITRKGTEDLFRKATNNLRFPFPVMDNSEFLNRGLLFPSSQLLSKGPISIENASNFLTSLATHRPVGIQFNPDKLLDSLKGGACSAMTLGFIASYFAARKVYLGNKQDKPGILLKLVSEHASQFSDCSEEMRDLQAAFNTIEIQSDPSANETVDHSRNKVQALANHYSLSIEYASSEIDVGILENGTDLVNEFNGLPEGVFLLRILKPANNEKLEIEGHSLAYINELGALLFYDPNQGLINLLPFIKGIPQEHLKVIFATLRSTYSQFGVDKARLYRLEPNS